MNKTGIEWCGFSWNPVTGCPPPLISPGCDNCYARRMAETRLRGRCGYDGMEPFGIRQHHERWLEPLRRKKPAVIFACSMGDLFHEAVFDFHIAQVFAVMALCPQHTFMILTKRAGRLEKFLNDRSTRACDLRGEAYQKMARRAGVSQNMDGLRWPLSNVIHGITICNQAEADEKLIPFQYLPNTRYFLSLEPMLGAIKLLPRHGVGGCMGSPVCLVIAGGETGADARPMHPDWPRGVRDVCQERGVPFVFKGWGQWLPCSQEYDGVVLPLDEHHWGMIDQFGNFDAGTSPFWECVNGADSEQTFRIGKKRAGRLLDGREWNEFPEVG